MEKKKNNKCDNKLLLMIIGILFLYIILNSGIVTDVYNIVNEKVFEYTCTTEGGTLIKSPGLYIESPSISCYSDLEKD